MPRSRAVSDRSSERQRKPRYEDHFRAVMEQKLRLSSEAAIRGHKKRLGELDCLFIRIYEDNVAGRITDEKFSMMSKTYEDEQAQLKVEIQTLQQEIEIQERQIENLEQFIQRLANILKEAKIGSVDESLLENESEKALYSAFRACKLDFSKPSEYLNELFGLKGDIDSFFD